MTDCDEEFQRLISELRGPSHGCEELKGISGFMKDLRKRKYDFLQSKLIKEFVPWIQNKENGILEERNADDSMYWFLQGCLIRSSDVLGPSGKNAHSDWLVLSVDCDCCRAKYISVGKVIKADDQAGKQKRSLAASFSSHKFFPIPPHGEKSFWMVAELDTPYYLEKEYFQKAKVNHMLSIEGWHLLNAMLQMKYTRSLNIEESESIRRGYRVDDSFDSSVDPGVSKEESKTVSVGG